MSVGVNSVGCVCVRGWGYRIGEVVGAGGGSFWKTLHPGNLPMVTLIPKGSISTGMAIAYYEQLDAALRSASMQLGTGLLTIRRWVHHVPQVPRPG